MSGNVLIGTDVAPVDDTRLFTSTDQKVGITSLSTYTTPWGYGMISAFPNWKFKAFAAINSTTGEEVFLVKGNGHVYATEITVRYPPFPDYVFQKNYNLMPLNKLSSYISTNGHLPNIPTAEEVKTNGIGVGELQSKQMEKIEELTLYILDLNEKLNALENKLEEVNTKLEESK